MSRRRDESWSWPATPESESRERAHSLLVEVHSNVWSAECDASGVFVT